VRLPGPDDEPPSSSSSKVPSLKGIRQARTSQAFHVSIRFARSYTISTPSGSGIFFDP
jgi:hypothetical protein